MAVSEGDRELRAPDFSPDSSNMEMGQEIDLIDLLYRLIEKAKYIVIAAVLGAIVAAVYSFFIAVPIYQATAKIYVMNPSGSAINLADLQIGAYLTSDYQEVFKTWEVHEMVQDELDLDYTYEQLQGMLSVSNPSNTRILNITINSDDPKEAKDVANAYAKVAKAYISQTMVTDEPNIMSDALEPDRPVSPRKMMNTLLGFVLGAFLAIGVFTVQYVMDDKVKTSDDILRYAGLPTFAIVPVLSEEGADAKHQKRGKK